MPLSMPRLALLLAPLASVAGCAPPGPYPSLAPRPIEQALAATDVEQPARPLADDPALPGRIAALTGQARHGGTAFEAALAAARAAVGKAGAAGSDGWIQAQQALSRAEAARETTLRALADLDALAPAQANARPLSAADLARLEAAVAEVQALADRQRDQLARLEASLGRI